jgi:hypothetical protein
VRAATPILSCSENGTLSSEPQRSCKLILVGLLALIIAGQAFAQTVKLEPKDRSKIKKYVLNSKGAPVTISSTDQWSALNFL